MLEQWWGPVHDRHHESHGNMVASSQFQFLLKPSNKPKAFLKKGVVILTGHHGFVPKSKESELWFIYRGPWEALYSITIWPDISSTTFVEICSSGGKAVCIPAWNCLEAFSSLSPTQNRQLSRSCGNGLEYYAQICYILPSDTPKSMRYYVSSLVAGGVRCSLSFTMEEITQHALDYWNPRNVTNMADLWIFVVVTFHSMSYKYLNNTSRIVFTSCSPGQSNSIASL